MVNVVTRFILIQGNDIRQVQTLSFRDLHYNIN